MHSSATVIATHSQNLASNNNNSNNTEVSLAPSSPTFSSSSSSSCSSSFAISQFLNSPPAGDKFANIIRGGRESQLEQPHFPPPPSTYHSPLLSASLAFGSSSGAAAPSPASGLLLNCTGFGGGAGSASFGPPPPLPMVFTGSSAAALATMVKQSSSAGGALSHNSSSSSNSGSSTANNSSNGGGTSVQAVVGAAVSSSHHSSSSSATITSSSSSSVPPLEPTLSHHHHHHLPFHESALGSGHHPLAGHPGHHHRPSAHSAASLAASAFTPASMLAAAGALNSALTGGGGPGGPGNKSLKTEDIFGLSQSTTSSFGSLTSIAGGLKPSPSSLLGGSGGGTAGSSTSSQMHSPTSPVGSPYGSSGGGGGGGNNTNGGNGASGSGCSGGGSNSAERSAFESMMGGGSNGSSNGARKKQSTRDPLSHRMIEKRRRDRMNNCLTDLSRLIPNSFIKKSSSLQNRGRIEKTEIIEMAIKYMKHLQNLAEPLLVDDGPLGPSPTTTPIPSVEHDQLFMLCNSHSSSTGTALLKDRHQFMRYGYQECVNEVVHFLEENNLESYYMKLMEHLNEHRENLNIGVVNKYMLAGNTANLGNSMINNYDENMPQLNAAHAAALANAAAVAAAAAASGNMPLPYQVSLKGEPDAQHHLSTSGEPMSAESSSGQLSNGHAGPSGPPPPHQSSYSLNAIKYINHVIDSSAGAPTLNSSEHQHQQAPPVSMDVDGDHHHNHHHNRHHSSPHSSASSLMTSKSAFHESSQTMVNSSGGGMISSSSCATSLTTGAASAGGDGNAGKIGNKSGNNADGNTAVAGEPGHFNFKKDIKDRFQKVLDRMSDGSTGSSSASSRNSSSASSFNSDGPAETSPPVSGGVAGITSSLATSIVPTVVDTTAAVNQIVCQLSSSGSLSSNSSSSTLSASETKSVVNDLQMISMMNPAISGGENGDTATQSSSQQSGHESKPSKEKIDIEAMYQKLSKNLLNTLSSLITACTSEYSSLESGSGSASGSNSGQNSNNGSGSTGSESVYVPIYAMHPSGHYYVPMHIEAAILGMKEEYTKSNKFPTKPPNSNSNPGSTKLANGDGVMGADEMEHEIVLHEQLEGRSAKKMRYDREPTVLLSQSIKFAFNSKPPEVFGKVDTHQVMLYPMTITVNLSHHQNVSLHTVFNFLREMLCKQVASEASGFSLNGCCVGPRLTQQGPRTTTINHAIEELKRQSFAAGKGGRYSDDLHGVDLSTVSRSALGKPLTSAFSSPLLMDSKSTSLVHQQHSFDSVEGGTMLAKHLLSGKRPASPLQQSSSLTPGEIAHMVAANQEHLNALTSSVDLSSTVPPSASATAAQMMLMLAAAAHNLEKNGSAEQQQQQQQLNAHHSAQLTTHHHSFETFGAEVNNKKSSIQSSDHHHHLSAFSTIDDSSYALKDCKSAIVTESNIPHAKTNGILKPIATIPLGHHPHSVTSIAAHMMTHHPSLMQPEPISDVKPELERLMNSSLYHKLTTPTSSGKETQGSSRNSHTPTLIIPNVPTSTTAAGSVPLTLPPGTSLHSLAHSGVYNGTYGGHHFLSATSAAGANSSTSGEQHPRESHHNSLFSPPMSVLNGGGSLCSPPPPPPLSPGSGGAQQQLRSSINVSTSGSGSSVMQPSSAPVAAPSLASYLQPHTLGQLNLSNYYSNLWASQLGSSAGGNGGSSSPYGGGNRNSASSLADFAVPTSSSSASSSLTNINNHKGSPLQSSSLTGNGMNPKTSTIASAVAAVAAANAAAAAAAAGGSGSASSANPYGMLSLFNGPGSNAGGSSPSLVGSSVNQTDPVSSSVAVLRAHFDQYSLFEATRGGTGGSAIGNSSAGMQSHHQPPIIQSISLDQYGLNSSLAAAAAAAAAAAVANNNSSSGSAAGKSNTPTKNNKQHHQSATSEPSSRPGSALTPMNLTKETAAAAVTSKLA